MKRSLLLLMIFSVVLATACKKDKSEASDAATPEDTEVEVATPETESTSDVKISASSPNQLIVHLEPKSGSNASGQVVFKQNDEVVSMVATFKGLDEGTHAVHIHESADCSADDGTSTGGHWNPTKQPHGEFGNAAGYHKGDIGNFEVDAKGNGRLGFVTAEWCIGCDDDTKDILNKAIIVHAGADDFTTQPTGNAGGRVSCGGIIQ